MGHKEIEALQKQLIDLMKAFATNPSRTVYVMKIEMDYKFTKITYAKREDIGVIVNNNAEATTNVPVPEVDCYECNSTDVYLNDYKGE